jgi:phosphatidylserine/phosphatidylglycerophosphate/cardiolipin synthase-like enzyme
MLEVSSSSSPIAVLAFQMDSSTGLVSALPTFSTPPEAYFSPRAGISSRIVQEIQRARSSIDIAIYTFTRNEIAEALIAARKRGVSIRVVADADEAEMAGSEIDKMENAGITVKHIEGTGGGIMHDKYAIFDHRLLLTGSYNWSTAAEDDNDENALFIVDQSLVAAYGSAFEALWTRD